MAKYYIHYKTDEYFATNLISGAEDSDKILKYYHPSQKIKFQIEVIVRDPNVGWNRFIRHNFDYYSVLDY